jgi:Arc/MetJ-type ribon-helix-helix transcriptional regulator
VSAEQTRVRSTAAPYERRRISIVITAGQRDAIDRLLSTGLFGLDRTDVVRRLIDRGLQDLGTDGWLEKRS